MVVLGTDVLTRFRRFTLYNSPYIAHREGRAIDLYPRGEWAPSPVAGTVLETRSVGVPSKPRMSERDHLIVIDTGEYVARILHVDPRVEAGDRIRIGDDLGALIRSGYFSPWVDNHIHLGFRPPERDILRASGSLRIHIDVPLTIVEWDGTGEIAETTGTYARLDSPGHPRPGEQFAAIGDDSGTVALDGGLPHYGNGGILLPGERADNSMSVPEQPPHSRKRNDRPRPFLGTSVGPSNGRELPWKDYSVRVNGREITGLSFTFGLESLQATLICPGVSFERGTPVTVTLENPE